MANLIGIINYGMGNIKSVHNAIECLGEEIIILEPEDHFELCSHLILPGVGAFPKAMQNICSKGIDIKIQKHVSHEKPLLGICLGMQMFASYGEEYGGAKGLDFIKGKVKKLDVAVHIPHVGWNNLKIHNNHPIFNDIRNDVDFYFVHSFQFALENNDDLLAITDYEKEITAAITNKKSVVGVQFHPEKSQTNGLKLFENFCNWNGKI